MKQEPAAKPPTLPGPTLVDYLLLLLGCALSLVLIHLSPLRAEPNSSVPEGLPRELYSLLPEPLRVSEGLILLWPFFFGLQRVRGRSLGLTAGEWLWVLSWVGVFFLTVLALWGRWGTLPEFLQAHAAKPRLLWYVILVPSMAALAVLLGLAGLVRRGPVPWTHSLSLALVIWPVLPLAGILAFGHFA